MTAPALFYGTESAPALFEANAGQADDGNAFFLRMRSNRIAPNGLALTATFSAVHLALNYRGEQTVFVRLYVDDVMVCERTEVLPARAEQGQYHRQVRMSVPVVVGGVEVARLHPRGTWAQVEIESAGPLPITVDGIELEWDPAGRL